MVSWKIIAELQVVQVQLPQGCLPLFSFRILQAGNNTKLHA